jgi:hypothetical protein
MGVIAQFWAIADHINSDYLFLIILCAWMLWMRASENAAGVALVGRAFHA